MRAAVGKVGKSSQGVAGKGLSWGDHGTAGKWVTRVGSWVDGGTVRGGSWGGWSVVDDGLSWVGWKERDSGFRGDPPPVLGALSSGTMGGSFPSFPVGIGDPMNANQCQLLMPIAVRGKALLAHYLGAQNAAIA